MDFKSILIPKDLIKKSKKLSYKYSFILNPWKEIYVNDDIRYETFEECEKIHNDLIKKYNEFGIKLIKVPEGSLTERYKFVQNDNILQIFKNIHQPDLLGYFYIFRIGDESETKECYFWYLFTYFYCI